MSGDERSGRMPARPVIYKSSALAAAAPALAGAGAAAAYESACIAAAAATAEAVRERFKAGQGGDGVPEVPGGGAGAVEADAVRHKRRVALNRNSAASSRLRKEAYVGALEAQLANLERNYNALFEAYEADARAVRERSDHETLLPPPLSAVVASAAAAATAAVVVEDPGARAPAPAVEVKSEGESEGGTGGGAAPPPGTGKTPAGADSVPAIPGLDELGIPPLPFVEGLAEMDPALVAEMIKLSGGEGGADPPVGEAGTEPLSDLLAAYYTFL
jgi:hypothetical protein